MSITKISGLQDGLKGSTHVVSDIADIDGISLPPNFPLAGKLADYKASLTTAKGVSETTAQKLEQTINAIIDDLSSKDSAISQLKTDVELLKSELSSTKSQLSSTQSQLASANAKADSAQAAADKAQKEADAAKASTATSKGTTKAPVVSKASLTGKISSTTTQNVTPANNNTFASSKSTVTNSISKVSIVSAGTGLQAAMKNTTSSTGSLTASVTGFVKKGG